ncbi:MAG: hypothetical protein KKC20_23515 [Proteobacteria bacterium]|nr:hypothetical protein [Pseudomonadota bacterium]
MNIKIVETKFSGTRSVCCGDDVYPKLPMDKVHSPMKKRAESMPCQSVCVYCVSCIKSMDIGGKTPRHWMDLLMGEATDPQALDTIKWHAQLQEYIDRHEETNICVPFDCQPVKTLYPVDIIIFFLYSPHR